MSLNVSTIELSGVFDGTKSASFHEDIRSFLDSGTDVILVDCHDLSFMDSSGLGAMIVALKTIRAAGKKLCICAINKQIGMLFDLTDTRRIFQIFADRVEFEAMALGHHSS
ncbi:MAG: STAS domain-containing protein [Thermosynechococcaceae cyanobacterium]